MLENLFNYLEEKGLSNKIFNNFYLTNEVIFEKEDLKKIFKKNSDIKWFFYENIENKFKIEINIDNEIKIIRLRTLKSETSEKEITLIKNKNITYLNFDRSNYLRINDIEVFCEDVNNLNFESFSVRMTRSPDTTGKYFFDRSFYITNQDFENETAVKGLNCFINIEDEIFRMKNNTNEILFLKNTIITKCIQKNERLIRENEYIETKLDEKRNITNIKYKINDFCFENEVNENIEEKFDIEKDIYLIKNDKRIKKDINNIINFSQKNYIEIFNYYDKNEYNIKKITNFIKENDQELLKLDRFLRLTQLINLHFICSKNNKKTSIKEVFNYLENNINIETLKSIILEDSEYKKNKIKIERKMDLSSF